MVSGAACTPTWPAQSHPGIMGRWRPPSRLSPVFPGAFDHCSPPEAASQSCDVIPRQGARLSQTEGPAVSSAHGDQQMSPCFPQKSVSPSRPRALPSAPGRGGPEAFFLSLNKSGTGSQRSFLFKTQRLNPDGGTRRCWFPVAWQCPLTPAVSRADEAAGLQDHGCGAAPGTEEGQQQGVPHGAAAQPGFSEGG